jgi:hypothetical protein
MFNWIRRWTRNRQEDVNVIGFGMASIVSSWALHESEITKSNLIVLSKINFSDRLDIYQRIPCEQQIQWNYPVVLVFPKSYAELIRLREVIPRAFAVAEAFSFGKKVWDNENI